MRYVLVNNSQVEKYPYSYSDLLRDNPNVSFSASPTSESLVEFGVFVVEETEQPEYDWLSERVAEGLPVFMGDKWIQSWHIQPLSTAEMDQQRQELIQQFVVETQERLDSFARTRNYDGILSACTYASDPVDRFRTEGQYCVVVRGSTWAKLYDILAEVESGIRPIPTSFLDIESELPALSWPVI
jgi:hypothetical protein